MFKNIIMWILNNVFHIQTQTTQKELQDNDVYAVEYERIDDINFNSIFSNKLANYVINDSNVNLTKENKRVELLDNVIQHVWKKAKKITSMGFGYGGVIIIPYVKSGRIYFNIVPQNRLTIDEMDGEVITGATILAEKRTVQQTIGKPKIFYRWQNYQVRNGNITITQEFTDDQGHKIPVPDFWQNIMIKQNISNVDRVLFGYIKSPINNRKANDKYGVPITYGCDATIKEIKETMKQLLDEYKLKQTFLAVDYTMFTKDKNGNTILPKDKLFKLFDGSGEQDLWQIYDPAFRPYTDRLQELYQRLEHEIGTSAGILSEVQTQNATATEIKRAMYDTFTIVDDMRSNIEKGIEDFLYSANVLANAYGLSPQGEYEVGFDWSYSLLEDSAEEFSQLIVAQGKGIVSDVEVRQWLKPDETLEESQKAIEEIRASQPSVEQILGSGVE